MGSRPGYRVANRSVVWLTFALCVLQCSLVDDLQARLTAAEEALASKQAKMDDMKQELFQKEKELETVSVFQAQVFCTLTPTSGSGSDFWVAAHSSGCLLCFFRPRSTPQTSTPNGRRERSSTKKRNAWPLSWST